jgi:hypothetical protein
VAGGCGDDDLVRQRGEAAVDGFEVPSGHFMDEVAAGAGTSSVEVGGQSAVGVAGDVVEVADGRIAERVSAGLVT